MAPLDTHDLQIAHDLGTVEGKLSAILENTKVLPELMQKVESHDTQLHLIRWIGVTLVGVLAALAVAWFGHR
jgi:hypothetical protein